MEPNQPNPNSGNWNQPINQGKELPGATASMILGIIALFCTTFLNCCYLIGTFPGLVLSIIGLVMGNKASKLYEADMGSYSVKSYKQAKAGKIMNLIALILCAVFFVLFIIVIAMGAMSEFDRYRSFDDFD